MMNRIHPERNTVLKRSLRQMPIAIGLISLLALSGCGDREGSSSQAPVDEDQLIESMPASDTAVDEVTWSVIEGEPATLDPTSSANLIIPNLCDNLLSLQPDFSVEPGLATSAEWQDDTTFVIDLRDGVTFWDGSEMTPEDVVYSLERNRNPESQWYSAFTLVEDIETSGDHQVTVSFTQHDADFRDAISGQAGAVMSAEFGQEQGKKLGTSDGGLMCTGPYSIDEDSWTPGRDIVTHANEDYWNGAPNVEELKYVFVTDPSTLSTALTEGDIDGAMNVSPASRSAFEGEGAGQLLLGPSTASYSFGPTTDEGPAANPKIRQALSMTIDRDKYIDTVLNGLGEEQKTIVPPFSFNSSETAEIYQNGYDELQAPEVDIEAAKKLVEESGEDVSEPLVVAVPSGSTEFKNTAQVIQSSAEKIGLTIEINELQPSDMGAMFYDPSAREGIDFVATLGYLETPGVVGYPSLFMLPPDKGGVFNWSGYDNGEVNELMHKARTAADETEAAKAFVAAQAQFAPDQLQVTLAGTYQLSYLNSDLTGLVTSAAVYSSPWAHHLGGK